MQVLPWDMAKLYTLHLSIFIDGSLKEANWDCREATAEEGCWRSDSEEINGDVAAAAEGLRSWEEASRAMSSGGRPLGRLGESSLVLLTDEIEVVAVVVVSNSGFFVLPSLSFEDLLWSTWRSFFIPPSEGAAATFLATGSLLSSSSSEESDKTANRLRFLFPDKDDDGAAGEAGFDLGGLFGGPGFFLTWITLTCGSWTAVGFFFTLKE